MEGVHVSRSLCLSCRVCRVLGVSAVCVGSVRAVCWCWGVSGGV